MKFKFGDKITIIKTDSYGKRYLEGAKGVVIENHPKQPLVVFEDDSLYLLREKDTSIDAEELRKNEWYVYNDEMELRED